MDDRVAYVRQEQCIRCGKCGEVCPMGLQPFRIGQFVRADMLEETKECNVLDCIECGCCAFTCPANLPLLDYCKLAKYELKRKK